MRKAIIGLLAALLFVPAMAHAQAVSSNDYCSYYPKQTVGATISSATDTSFVPLVAGTAIYVCDANVNQAGGTGTVYLESATAASCGGTLTQLSGTFTANTTAGSTTDFHLNPGSVNTSLVVPTGDALCVHSTGTIVQGVTVTYVQR